MDELAAAATAFSDDPMSGPQVNYSSYEYKLHCMRDAREREEKLAKRVSCYVDNCGHGSVARGVSSSSSSSRAAPVNPFLPSIPPIPPLDAVHPAVFNKDLHAIVEKARAKDA